MNPETKELLRTLLGMARSDEPAQHAQVLGELRNGAVLARLDTDADYEMASKFRLRVAQVVEALARNPAASAQNAFVVLTSDPVFLAHDERIIALIRASAHVRPAPAPLVAFWDQHCRPDDGFTPTTVTALVDNGSPPALELLERKMADPGHEDDEKISWMRTDMLTHRNAVPQLEMCERMLNGALPPDLCPALVEAIFDYRPQEWFRPAKSYSAPRLESASREALDVLMRVAIVALTMIRLTDEQRAVVNARRQEAEKLREQWPA